MTQQVGVNLSKTKIYVLFQDLEQALKSDPRNVAKELENLEDEIMRLTMAHSLFVFSIRNSYLEMNNVGIEKGVSPVFKEQLEVFDNIISRIKSLNNYYYADEQSNQSGVDKKD